MASLIPRIVFDTLAAKELSRAPIGDSRTTFFPSMGGHCAGISRPADPWFSGSTSWNRQRLACSPGHHTRMLSVRGFPWLSAASVAFRSRCSAPIRTSVSAELAYTKVIFSGRNVTELLTNESARQGSGFVRPPALDSVSSFQLSRTEQTEVKCIDGSVWTGTRPGASLAMD
jgi:hypothetical protein